MDRSNRHQLEPIRHDPKFILDVHLGKLAKYLRMLGFDTLYRNNFEDQEIRAIAQHENRVILTKDSGLLAEVPVEAGFHIQSQDAREQVSDVLAHFDLVPQANPFSRCIECNGIVRTVPKETVATHLEPATRQYYEEFFECTSCHKIYWKGSHYIRMISLVERFLQ